MKKQQSAHEIHLSIAETGKLYALKGDHKEALRHYQEAIRLAVSSSAPEIFFRHYTQCVLESLELTHEFDEIIRFCLDAHDHYKKLNLNSTLHRRDHGSILERLGMVQLKKGDIEAGRASLESAQQTAGEGILPATEEVLGWLMRGFTVDVTRLLQSQRRHHYFVVRAEKVDTARAKQLGTKIKMPDQATVLTG